MAKRIEIDAFTSEIAKLLNDFADETAVEAHEVIDNEMNKLVSISKEKAPVGKRKGKFKRNITSSQGRNTKHQYSKIWHVKGKEYRLTHLINNGHQTRNGGRTHGASEGFLNESIEAVEKEIVKGMEDIFK